MPIVSINLSPKAYQIYDYLAKTRKASSIVSQCLVNWDLSHIPELQAGDRRTMDNGDELVWTDEGWVMMHDGILKEETANEKWIREQKELNE